MDIVQIYLPGSLARLIDSYREAWIDIDRILFFCGSFITYGGYTNYPNLDTTEYGLNRTRLRNSARWGCYKPASELLNLADGQKQKHSLALVQTAGLLLLSHCAFDLV